MELGLGDKRALIMGSTRGMGRAIAERLAHEGARVALCGRELATAAQVAEEINAATHNNARGYALDLGQDSSVEALIAALDADFGGIDIILCNGGGPPPGRVADVAPELWMAQFQPMFVNQLRLVSAFLPGMRERKWGRILVLSSSGVLQPIPNLGISNALRSSLIGWAKTLSNEVAPDGVTVNTIMPGRIKTDRVDQIDAAAAEREGKTVEEIVRASRATIPIARYGTVEEFADVAAFLMSERASYVTGGLIRVDGGAVRSV